MNYTTSQFSEKIGLSAKTLLRWDREGTLKPKRTSTHKRSYDDADLQKAILIVSKRLRVLLQPGKEAEQKKPAEPDLNTTRLVSMESLAKNTPELVNVIDEPMGDGGIRSLLQLERIHAHVLPNELADRLGWPQSRVPEIRAADAASLTVETVVRMLNALGTTALITLSANGVVGVAD